MENRIIFGLIAIAAIVEGLAAGSVPMNLLPLGLVVLGLVYGVRGVDAEDPAGVLSVVIATAVAADANVLSNIQVIGGHLDSILDQLAVAYLAIAAAVVSVRVINRVKG
ncbi:MAG: hypothetical protein OXC05_06520 [Halieaceae bacterium]|nr:hypothetical protein [Halieaceae bacterium]